MGGGEKDLNTDTNINQCDKLPSTDTSKINLIGSVGSIFWTNIYGIPRLLQKYRNGGHYGNFY